MKEYVTERHGMGIVTNLQLSFSGLERAERGQRGIQGFFNNGNAGPSSARGSPAPAPATLSKKALGKRKADNAIVDLTLDDGDSGEEEQVRSRSLSREEKPVKKSANGHQRSRSAPSTISDDEGDSDIEIVETAPVGPVYQCPRCAAIISLQADDSGDLVAARKKAEKSHNEWHERYAAANGLSKKPKKDKPPKKKKKGQQKLKSFFKKG